MAACSARECVVAFLDGFYAGDIARVEACCDENFTSLTHSPVEIFPHHGLKTGKEWLAEAIRIQQERFSARSYALHFIAVEGQRVATITRASLTKRNDGRVIDLTVADFFVLGGGLIREHHHFLDSLDLLQQLLGRDLTEPLAASVRGAMR
ncbi:MAG: nuclear transport factor 2 family protein [Xanthobacteraceae bacterium]|nr:nuclear transport factor 2 family protein [Xanthobacteraceae bacterium]